MSIDGPAAVRVGEEFPVTVHFASELPATRLRVQLRFDSSAMQMIGATSGDVVPAAAGSPNIEARTGGAQMEIVATADDPVRGSGDLMTLRFKALKARPQVSVAAMLSMVGTSGAATGTSSATPVNIAIQQQ